MLENMMSAISRVEEIKARFRQDYVGGAVTIAPHYTPAPGKNGNTAPVQPFFPDYLKAAVKKVASGPDSDPANYDAVIDEAAAKNGLEPALLKAVIRAESGFNPKAVSKAGACGLMQLMPSTAAGLGVSNPFDPEQNINGGARYLKLQLDRFGGDVDKALAAYNAGPGAVIKYNGVPPYRETRGYVSKVLSYRDQYTDHGS